MFILAYLFAFAQPQIPQLPQVPQLPQYIQMGHEPISSTILLYAIGAALLAIGGLLAWIIKAVIPKLIESFQKQSDALIKAVELFPDAIKGLHAKGDAIEKGIHIKVDAIESSIKSKIEVVETKVEDLETKIVGAIHDKNMKDIVSKLDSIDAASSKDIK